ncbi:glycerol-3-phosphate dehydrogenase subunit GlpB [Halorhabdus sp. CBA1104]|uniref:glycerol-3-phosphate dehydrogenase subunit GlpB n=1 Tax=unclassified Halorhabdus TaxID=2621901 RepID=UPI0012B24386|nr:MULTISPECIES: glycerol-3-phosphate dehydrogenase subunit GlpB [unclassified Halorhabdus]QGN08218.1 glycerol-3-phosphate dehydrogenase subunit GlpB [Halorhabdus sp. CBA1104]
MAIEQDVLVIGGGIAGLSTALGAAREGADVRLLSESETTLRHASGLLDVMGYTPDGDGPLVDPFDAIGELPARHPYATVGESAVRDGLAMVDDILGETYRGEHTDDNALVPTYGGTIKPTARYPDSVAPGLASDDRAMLLVGFERVTAFDAATAAAHLDNTGLPAETSAATVEFPVIVRDDAKVTRYAHLLDENPELTHEGRTVTVREAVAEAVKPHCESVERVGFPAVLGEDHPNAVRRELTERLDTRVFELPMGPPSLLGKRLESRLYGALDEAGGHFEIGSPVVDAETDDGVVSSVFLDRSGQKIPYAAEQFVLATGGVAGQGIEADREAVAEPLFGCHVPHPTDRYEWFDEAAFGDHPFARFGVAVDEQLRPTDADGTAEFPNLRAAGAVIEGYDYAAEKSGSGVSIATGYEAGRRAATEV